MAITHQLLAVGAASLGSALYFVLVPSVAAVSEALSPFQLVHWHRGAQKTRVFVRGFRLLHKTEGIGTLVPRTTGPELHPSLPTVPSRGEASCVWRVRGQGA